MIGKVIHDLLDQLVSDKVYPIVAPQGAALPFITYQVIDKSDPWDTKGADSDADLARVQINIFTTTYSAANTLAASVRGILDFYTGTNNSVVVDRIRFAAEYDLGEDLENYYRISQDYMIRIKN